MTKMFLKMPLKLEIPQLKKITSLCLKQVRSSCISQSHVHSLSIGDHHNFLDSVSEAVSEDDNRTAEMDTNCEVSIGSDICEREQDDHVVPFQDLATLEYPVAPVAGADDQPSPLEILAPTDQGSKMIEHYFTYDFPGKMLLIHTWCFCCTKFSFKFRWIGSCR